MHSDISYYAFMNNQAALPAMYIIISAHMMRPQTMALFRDDVVLLVFRIACYSLVYIEYIDVIALDLDGLTLE